MKQTIEEKKAKAKEYYKKNRKEKIKYEQKKRDKKYDPRDLCKKCQTLFYQENKGSGVRKCLCKNCLEPIKKFRNNSWSKWEDNLIRQFYFGWEKKKLLNAIHRTWCGICHRAKRLNIKRNPKFKSEATTKSNLINNPMNNLKTREKLIKSLQEYYETHSSWNKGKHIWANGNHPRGMLNKHHTKESIKAIIEATSGEKAHAWLGGISFEPYDFNFNKRFKKAIKLRDEYSCQICFTSENLCVHHIDYNKFNSNETNCITLCLSCHGKTNTHREYWENKLYNFLHEKYNYIKCIQKRFQ